MENLPSYYAIIPANIRYNKNLTPKAILLYGEITALCNKKGYCWAQNKYFADLYECGSSSIERWIKSLKNEGYISIELSYKPGTKQIEKRTIHITEGIPKNGGRGIPKNEGDNNTDNNNITKVMYKGKQVPLLDLQIQFNSILSRTIKDIGGFTTGINNDSKIMRTVYTYLMELKDRSFLSGKTLGAVSLKNMDASRIEKIDSDRALELILKRAARNWKRIQEDDSLFGPEKIPSLDKWFYSYRPGTQGMSWFLYCACNCLEETYDTVTRNQLNSIKEKIDKYNPGSDKLTKILYNKGDTKYWGDKDWVTFYKTMLELITWYEDNKKTLREQNDGLYPHFGTVEVVFKKVKYFREEYLSGLEPHPVFLSLKGTLWGKFSSCMKNEFDINLEIKYV